MKKRFAIVLALGVVVGLLLVPTLSSACHNFDGPDTGDTTAGAAGITVWLTPPGFPPGNGDVGVSGPAGIYVEGDGQASTASGFLAIGAATHEVGGEGSLTTVPPTVTPCVH